MKYDKPAVELKFLSLFLAGLCLTFLMTLVSFLLGLGITLVLVLLRWS